MPTEGEGGSAETPQMQTAPTTPVLDFASNFPVTSPRKVSGNRVTNWSSSDYSGRITSLAPGSNTDQNQSV